MNFYGEVIEYLIKYKRERFPLIQDGTWRDIKYGYILPKEKYRLNLLEFYRERFFKNDLSNIKFHMYFHHLNSSQAMCINFFFPLYEEKKLEFITEYLGLNGEKVKYNTVQFEKESEIDGIKNLRATNFDFYFETLSGTRIFFEIKYTEREFGVVKNDTEHRRKYNSVYGKNLNSISPNFRSPEYFFLYYQLMRNLIHTDQNSHVVFLYPKRNMGIHNGVETAKNKIAANAIRQNVHSLEWKELMASVRAKNDNSRIQLQIDEFENKYLL